MSAAPSKSDRRRSTVVGRKSVRNSANRKNQQSTGSLITKDASSYTGELPACVERYSDYAESEDDVHQLSEFNEVTAREELMKFSNCTKIVLSIEKQREMAIEIGVNLSAEHPWKQIGRNVLLDFLEFDGTEMLAFQRRLKAMKPDDILLIGYAASMSEDEDTFLVFNDYETSKEASRLIERLEAFERRRARRALIKQPRKWKSFGSEASVDLFSKRIRDHVVDVEVQSVFPFTHSTEPFTLRMVADVRDGYVELVPRKEIAISNVFRRTVDAYVQSAPPNVDLEQQTDPTFPTNAWSQYLYEIGQEKIEEKLPENAGDGEEPSTKKRHAKCVNPLPIIPSDRVQDLIDSLEFNQVDMYRNDYPHIIKVDMPKYKLPYLSEFCCFVDMKKSLNRYVCSIDWHPVYSGIMVISYTFSTPCSIVQNTDTTDIIKQAVLEPNTVLLWSFDNSLHPKLQLETSREITCISFCPYDENVIIGGTINGQIIIWDLTNRLHKAETEDILSPAQFRYRTAMRSFLMWTKQDNTDCIVRPAAISSLQLSHKSAITSIQWLNKKYYVTTTGNIKETENRLYRFFVTASIDCSVAFWNLDFVDESAEAKRAGGSRRKAKLPDHMLTEDSVYEHLNRVFHPDFMIVYNRPVLSMILDTGVYKYYPISSMDPYARELRTRTKHDIEEVPLESFAEQIVAATFLGNLSLLKWSGADHRGGELVKKESVKKADMYAQVHDGHVLVVDRNPFLPSLFLSIGRNVLALWTADTMWTAIFWRRRAAQINCVKWSLNRPSVFFVSRSDGSFEAWDILSRTDEPCLVDVLGGSTLSYLSQHKLSLPQNAVVVGDYNSSARLLIIPNGFTTPLENETKLLQAFVDREMFRKEHIEKWQGTYYAANADIREAKRLAAVEAQSEFERLDKEQKEKEEMRLRKEAAELRKAKARETNKAIFTLPEKLDKKWDEMNIARLMKVLMSMKMVDPKLLALWTKPEKDRIAYNVQKQKAIEESFRRVSEDMATLRARLLPTAQSVEDRDEFVRIQLNQLNVMCIDDGSGDSIEKTILNERDTFSKILQHAEEFKQINMKKTNLELTDILQRGHQRREVINKSLGSNTQHRHTYFTEIRGIEWIPSAETVYEEKSIEPQDGEESAAGEDKADI